MKLSDPRVGRAWPLARHVRFSLKSQLFLSKTRIFSLWERCGEPSLFFRVGMAGKLTDFAQAQWDRVWIRHRSDSSETPNLFHWYRETLEGKDWHRYEEVWARRTKKVEPPSMTMPNKNARPSSDSLVLCSLHLLILLQKCWDVLLGTRSADKWVFALGQDWFDSRDEALAGELPQIHGRIGTPGTPCFGTSLKLASTP